MTPRLLRGSVLTAAVLIEARVIDDVEARRRLLSLWIRGAEVRRLGLGWLLVWPEPRRIRTATAPGLLFERRAGRLIAVDADESALEATGVPVDAVVHMAAGVLVADTFSALPEDDPSTWLNADAFVVAAVTPLASPPPPPGVTVPEPPLMDLRGYLAIPADPEADRVAAALLTGPAVRQQGSPGETIASHRRGLIDFLTAFWERLREGPRRAGSVPAKASTRGGRLTWLRQALRGLFVPTAARRAAADRPGSPGPPSSVGVWVSRVLGRWLLMTRLSSFIGRQHARYLAQVMRFFEEGDLDSALRHAVPLGREGHRSELLGWATPRPRGSLAIGAFASLRSSAVGIGGELFVTLERLYREAHERLAAAGRIDEAAFVLAELLRASEEAIAFLERHGRLQLAAELAEGRDLAPGLQVRQWFLAGNTARALEIAWRRDAFADAVVRLERSGRRDTAAALRRQWADSLASAGDYAGAVDAVWAFDEARDMARRWIALAIAQGGPAGARMLARRLLLEPAAFEETRRTAELLLSDDSGDLSPARAALGDELRRLAPSPLVTTLSRAAVRALVRDVTLFGGGAGSTSVSTVLRLLKCSEDEALAVDMPEFVDHRPTTLAERERPLTFAWRGDDVGQLPAEDVAFLPDGRLLVAMGELGVRVLSRQGRLIADIDQPATRLVVADRGDRAIALIPRGEVWRLARIDLSQRRGRSWSEARLASFAHGYDGGRWFVASEDALHAIDVPGCAGSRFDGPWRVGDVHVVSINRVEQGLQLIVRVGDALELWVYETPSLTLRRREAVSASRAGERHVVLVDGRVLTLAFEVGSAPPGGECALSGDGATRTAGLRVDSGQTQPFPLSATAQLLDTQAAPGWLLLTEADAKGQTVRVIDAVAFLDRARLRLARASRVAMRVAGNRLTIGDNLGRVVVLDLDTGQLLRDLRI